MAIVVPANEEGRKFYEQAEVKPAKWLLPDGSITDKFPMAGGGSDVKLQNNKEVSITQNGEIEITPDSGYDGVKKVTATVNVSGGATPSKETPSWFNNALSVVPSGLQIVGVSNDDLNNTVIITGDGESTLAQLLDGKVFNQVLASYGESVVFAYYLNA